MFWEQSPLWAFSVDFQYYYKSNIRLLGKNSVQKSKKTVTIYIIYTATIYFLLRFCFYG